MTSAFLSPKWKTNSGHLVTALENSNVAIQLVTVDDAQFTGVDNTNAFIFEEYEAIDYIKVNGSNVSHTNMGNTIYLQSVVQSTDVIQVVSNNEIEYTILHDVLPTGVSLSNTGLISGRVRAVDPNKLTYNFSVRANNGSRYRDRQFSIGVEPVPTSVVPPTWGSFSYKYYNENGLSFAYVDLGSSTRGVPFYKDIDIFQTSGLDPILELIPMIDFPSPFDALPVGLEIVNKAIVGNIDTDNDRGTYFFKLRMLDYEGNIIGGDDTRIFGLTITSPTDTLSPLRIITWVTESDLGTLSENEPSPFSLYAYSTTGENLRYKVNFGYNLPSGLSLDEITGEIRGIAAHSASNSSLTTSFSVRAFIDDDIYVDKVFNITVLAKYFTPAIMTLSIPIYKNDAKELVEYIESISPDDYVFRPNDQYYGLQDNLNIYLISGLTPNANAVNIIKNSKFKFPVKLSLGDYKLEKVMHNGKYVYDMIYREVIDPFSGAGGYSLADNIPTEQTPINPIDNQPFYTTSLNNIRYETVRTFGLSTTVNDLKYKLGNSGIENMPQWMRSKGELVYGIALGYYKPNMGVYVLNSITYPENDPHISQTRAKGFTFDAYNYTLETQEISSETRFDDSTSFDDQSGDIETIFDGFSYYDNKVIFINGEMP